MRSWAHDDNGQGAHHHGDASHEHGEAQGEHVHEILDGDCKKKLWEHLPRRLPPDYAQRLGSIEYDPKTEEPPFTDDFKAHSKSDGKEIHEKDVFKEKHYASLEKGKIKRTKSKDRESWDFPDGTTFVHEIYYNVSPRKLFELRVLKKIEGKWEFGVYTPATGNSRELVLSTDCSDDEMKLPPRDLKLASDAGKEATRATVEIERVRPDSCTHCHFMMSPNSRTNKDDLGPCDFGPETTGIKAWIEEETAKHGYPFRDAAATRPSAQKP